MKTIEEEAIDCALKDEFPNGYDAECAGFKAGVKFAEEWIKDSDELPSEENGYIEEEVLVRDSDNVSAVAIYRLEEYWESFDERIGVIKEWRPIHRNEHYNVY